MTPTDFSTPVAALVAGAITSLHCVGMCGPLVCSTCPSGGVKGFGEGALYHGGRLFSYTLLGGVLGFSGASIGEALGWPIWHLLPWAFLLLFLAAAFAWDPVRFAKLPPFLAAPLRNAAKLRGTKGALLLGLATPLLPCGPLYIAFGAAATSGSPQAGALLMACFGAGTIALLEVLRTQMGTLQKRVSPTTLRRIQQGLAVSACLLLALRLVWPSIAPASEVPSCPMCH